MLFTGIECSNKVAGTEKEGMSKPVILKSSMTDDLRLDAGLTISQEEMREGLYVSA
jgi:hypothetical protein